MRRPERLAWALGLLAASCAAEAPPPAASPDAGRVISDRAVVIGEHMRAALACHLAVPVLAQDRAAAIESAALAHQQREGGAAARDAWLQALNPPTLAPRRLTAWCADRRPDIDRVVRWLDGEEGAAFAARATEVLHQ